MFFHFGSDRNLQKMCQITNLSSIQAEDTQESVWHIFFGDQSQCENLSEVKPLLAAFTSSVWALQSKLKYDLLI